MIVYDQVTLKVRERVLLEAVSLRLRPGEKAVIRGVSGCGKSSLLKAATGIVPLAAGRIEVDGLTLVPETVAHIRARTAYVGQEPLAGTGTVREALLLPFTFRSHRDRMPGERSVLEGLERMRLGRDILDKLVTRISGGEKQRIAVLRALLLDKQFFLADEITSALDPESRAAVMEELFQPAITLLSVSHDPVWAEACDRRITVREARLTEEDA